MFLISTFILFYSLQLFLFFLLFALLLKTRPFNLLHCAQLRHGEYSRVRGAVVAVPSVDVVQAGHEQTAFYSEQEETWGR